MDYNDEFSPSRLNRNETEFEQNDGENRMAENWRSINGVRRQDMFNCPDKHSLQYDQQNVDDTFFRDKVASGHFDKSANIPLAPLNDVLNSNKQNVEGSQMKNAMTVNSYDSRYGRMHHNLAMLPEDLRISKILRRLMSETNRKAAVDLCKKLETAVRNQSNGSYICRAFDILFDNMITILLQCPVECLEYASTILGIMGYINRYDFVIYKCNLTKAYAEHKSIRKYLMSALKTTIRCDAVNLDLKTSSERLLGVLKEYLENAEVTENFISISETIAEFSKNYKASFQKHFTDIVDIIIGWHLEVEQPAELKRHCAKILQQMAEYFLNELDFTFGLLGQFIEDIEACRDDMLSEESSPVTKQQTEIRVGAFIGAFTSIVKALTYKGINLNEFGSAASILRNAKEAINKATTICYDITPHLSEETVVNLNEFCTIILYYDRSVENLNLFENIILMQLKYLSTFNDNQQASFLFMALNLVRQYRTQLPLSFITLLLGTDCQVLQDLKLNCGTKTYKLLMKIYHEILLIKNVPLLQEAYRHILDDINKIVATLNSKDASLDTMMRCEMLFNFYLASLTALACQTSSIIGMYALKPSILELLIKKCQGSSYSLWHKYPTLHSALLELLINHCQKNHNFRQSSRLLHQHQESPSSENFALILKFLAELLKWFISEPVLIWLENILQECLEDHEILTQKNDFLNICENISLLAIKQPRECSSVLETLLKYPNLPQHILSNIRDLTLCVMESSDESLSAAYCKLLALIPLEICLTSNGDKLFFTRNQQRILTLFQWHKSSSWYNGLRPKFFKLFLESLDPNTNVNYKLYPSFIEKSSCNLQREHFMEYLKTLQENQQLLSYHLQYEAARYCVQQKLRTTLGKPQETFLGIEAIIMKYARFLAEKEGLPSSYKNLYKIMEIQKNCRMLLGFLEYLEKHIYNASEGTAYAMLPAEKPAKTFFRVNAPTCREWFKRIRTAVNLISLHCMEPAMVIRYSEIILQVEANHTNLALIDRTVTSLVWALYNCVESDTICGLSLWLKTKHGKRYEWIQFVAEHASGHLEKAATGYLNLLNDEKNKTMDTFMKDFIQKQLTDCLYHTARWSEISAISQETVYSRQHLEIIENMYQSSEYQKFDWKNQELNMALLELTEWPEDNKSGDKTKLTPKLDSFSYYEVLRKLQDSCIAEIKTDYLDKGVLESVRSSVQQGIREGLLRSYEPGLSNNTLDELTIINHVSQKLSNNEEIQISSNDTNLDINISSRALSKCLHWKTLYNGQHNVMQKCNLLLNLASKARLENNLNYCHSLLSKFFNMKHINLSPTEIAQRLKLHQFAVDSNDKLLIQGLEELIKYQLALTTSTAESIELSSACCYEILQNQKHVQANEDSQYPESLSSLLLSMADWLTLQRLNNTNLASGELFQKLQNLLPELPFVHSTNSKSNILPTSEYNVGKLLNTSILCNYNSGEAWFSYGNWCYRWGKKLMESKMAEQTSTSASSGNDAKDIRLTKRNICSIQETLKDKFNSDVTEKIVEVLNNNIMNAIHDDSTEDLETNLNSENTTELLEKELKKICNLDVNQLKEIFSIWRQAQKGVYSYYEEATRAYFKYLAIESEKVSKKADIPISDNNEVEDCTFVTTTLRLLRLIVKHAIGLQDVLEDGLRNTPLRPWKVIVPQLFSRLNHHEPYVRKSLLELLCRLAVNQPQLIIFPAVVGAQQELKYQNQADAQTLLTNCFGTLLNSLSEQASETVLQVQLLVKELRRITLLWDEYWMHSLSQLYAEYSSLYNALDAEAKKCSNSELMEDKYEVFRQHLLADFKQIAAVTEKEPETNYERTFQERFGTCIASVLKELQKSNNEASPAEYWHKIKQLYNLFQQRPLRGSSSNLRVAEISPALANMQNTTIAMPGVDTYAQPAVFIKSVDATAFIFTSTKTKPKKLSFFGSNGQRYTYLFKGQEDLHLDERIMQFLAISNSMMARSYGSKAKLDCFKANHYSVIPLGSRSGLIRWVDNCSPLFAIYKKWQQRDALLKQQQRERLSSKIQEQMEQSPVPNNATRPSELFYNKLTPLLAECNLKVTDPRRQWPTSVLKRVLKELSDETPKDLLSKEIWCYSANAVEWRKSVRRYSLSLAVMSIIGYVIGLGDRHLDNVLIKLSTGEILHIDYSVCFEKGKTLRVPEKVPFRMTQNLKDALGLVGTEGAFRLACTHVLKILRKERETLLTLLEAFVYDPLVDWTVSDDGTTTVSRRTSAYAAANIISSIDIKATNDSSSKTLNNSKKLEPDISKQTLAMKINEFKTTVMKYKNDFDSQLNEMYEHIKELLDTRKNIAQLELERDNLSKQLAMVRELEALGSAQASHAFIQRYNLYRHSLHFFKSAKYVIQETLQELESLIPEYFNVIHKPFTMQEFDIDIDGRDAVHVNEFDIIKDVLIENNWNNEYEQAHFNRQDMENAFIQIKRAVLECRDLLTFYVRVIQFYPRSRSQNHPWVKYRNALSNLLESGKNSNKVCSPERERNIEINNSYFKSLNAKAVALHENVVQAKTNLEENKQHQIMNCSTALNAINDFISLNPSNNNQILIVCMRRRVWQSFQHIQQLEQNLLQNRDYFLPNKQLNFLQLVKKFTELICESCNTNVPNNEVFLSLITALECICNVRVVLESIANKILSVMMADDSVELKGILNTFQMEMDLNGLDKHTDLKKILNNIDCEIEKLEISFKTLQEKILQEVRNDEENPINNMSFLNTNVNNTMQKLGTDFKISLIANLKSIVHAFTTHDVNNVFDVYKLRSPIENLVFKMQSEFLEGLLVFAITNLSKSMSNSFSTPENIHGVDLSNAALLCTNLYVALQHEFVIDLDDFVLKYHYKILDEFQLVATAYYWLNEHNLKEEQDPSSSFITKKQTFLTRLTEAKQVLIVWKSTIIKIQEDLQSHINSIIDFVHSVSATNIINIKQHQFEEIISENKKRYENYLHLCILLYEKAMFVIRTEFCPEEQTYKKILKHFDESHQRLEQFKSSLTEVERNLIQLLDPEDNIDQCWIENVSGLIDEMIFSSQKKISDLEKQEKTLRKSLFSDGQQMQTLLDASLRSELRQLLKILTRVGKQTLKSDSEELCQDLKKLQQLFKIVQTKLIQLQSQLYAKEFDSPSIAAIQDKIDKLKEYCQKNIDELNLLLMRFLQFDAESDQQTDQTKTSSQNDLANKEVISSQISEQKRNAYAVSVWKRIRMKLEGRDPDHNRRSSAAEQVEFVIREATNEENLASLYEGWTPWV